MTDKATQDFLEIIETRRSCRKYTDRQVEDEILEKILKAGTYAPSAMGAQDPIIVAVKKPSLLDRLRALNAKIMGSENDPYYGSPVIVLVFVSESNKNGLQDGSCALENMMLAAHALGLASCWINREIEMFRTDEGKALMREMDLPEGLMGVGALSLGYRGGEPSPRKERKADYFRIIG